MDANMAWFGLLFDHLEAIGSKILHSNHKCPQNNKPEVVLANIPNFFELQKTLLKGSAAFSRSTFDLDLKRTLMWKLVGGQQLKRLLPVATTRLG